MAAAFRTGDIFSRLVHCSEDGIDEALKGCELPDAKKLGSRAVFLPVQI